MKGEQMPQVPFDAERSEDGDGVEPISSSRSGKSSESVRSEVPAEPTGAVQSERQGLRFARKPTVIVVVTAIVAAMMFAGAYAAGRSAVTPTDSDEYRALVARIADVKRKTEADKAEARKTTSRLESVQEQQQAATKRLEEAKQTYQRYVPEGSVADQPIKIESFDVGIASDGVGIGSYVHPKFVVRNTSGHVIVKLGIIGDIVKPDGTVVDADQYVSGEDIRLMPGRTAVIEKDLLAAKGSRGDLFKPKRYYCQTYVDASPKTVQFGDDVTAKVIS